MAKHNVYQNETDNPIETSVYESLAEFIDDSDVSSIHAFSADRDTKFIGRDMTCDARRKAIQAYQPGLDNLDACRDDVRDVELPQPKTRSRRARFDEFDGDDICLDRLRCGSAFWRTTQRQETSGPQSMTIGIDIAANAGTDAKSISWRGVAGILLAELLESAGVRVELWAISRQESAYENGNGRLVALQLKSAGAPMDVVSLVNATAGWFFRSFLFEAIRTSHIDSIVDSGLGYTVTPMRDEVIAATGVEFDAVITDCLTRSDCLEVVRKLLQQFSNADA